MTTADDVDDFQDMAKDAYQDRLAEFAAGPPCEWEAILRYKLDEDPTLGAEEHNIFAAGLLDILDGRCVLRGGSCACTGFQDDLPF